MSTITPAEAQKLADALNEPEPPADLTGRVLGRLNLRCTVEEPDRGVCGARGAILCESGDCDTLMCPNHVWICPKCEAKLCSWHFDAGRHECGESEMERERRG